MTLKQLDYFMAVAEALNFSEAAKQLFISQPALSRSIIALEEELGVILLFRTRHSVALTPAGMSLASQVPHLKRELEKMLRLVQQAAEGVRGKLVFSAQNGTLLPEVISSAFEYFRNSLPYIELELHSSDCPDICSHLDNGTADIVFSAFTDSQLQSYAQYSSIVLGSQRVFLALPESSHHGREELSAADLRNDCFVFPYSTSSPLAEALREICSAHGFAPQLRKAENAASQMLWIEQGYGLGLFPENHRVFSTPGIRRCALREELELKSCILWNPFRMNSSLDLFTKLIRGDI